MTTDLDDRPRTGFAEDVWETTAKLIGLRYDGQVLDRRSGASGCPTCWPSSSSASPRASTTQEIFGDILGFLPTGRTIEPVCDEIERALGEAYRDDVFPLISTLPKDRQSKALGEAAQGRPAQDRHLHQPRRDVADGRGRPVRRRQRA